MIPPDLHLRLLPVGMGDCIILRFPDNTWAVVDCAAASCADRDAAQMAASLIASEGTDGVPVRFVVGTHPDNDHVGGLPAFLRLCPQRIQAFYYAGVECRLDKGARKERIDYVRQARLLTATGKVGIVAPVAAGDTLVLDPPIPGLVINVLNPDAATVHKKYVKTAAEKNNASVVLQISFFGRTILLTGDIEQTAWVSVTSRADFLAPQVLKVPHHGAKNAKPPVGKVMRGDGLCWALLSTPSDDASKPHQDVLDVFWSRKNYRTRCTGWSPSCPHEQQERYPPSPENSMYPPALLNAILATGRGVFQPLLTQVGCCVDNEIVIPPHSDISHSVAQKKCDTRQVGGRPV